MEPTEDSVNFDVQKIWLSIKRRWLPATGVFGTMVVLAAVVATLPKPTYQASGKLLIQRVDQASAVTGLAATGVGQQIGQLDAVAQQSNPLKTETEVLTSTPIVQKTINTLNLKDEKGNPLTPGAFVKGNLKVKNVAASDVLELTYKSKDGKEAAAAVNQLMNLYIENNILTNRSKAAAAGDFIAKQLPATEVTVRQAEMLLRRFKEQNHVVSLQEEAKSAVAAIQDLDSKISDTQAQLADVSAQTASLQNKVGTSSQQALATNTLNQSPGVQKALEELQQVESQLKEEEARFTDVHPTVENLKQKRDALKALLQERVGQSLGVQQPVSNGKLQIGDSKQKLNDNLVQTEVTRLGLANHLRVLSDAEVAYRQRVSILPKLEEEQRELERRLEAAQSTYETLLKKLQEVRVAENENTGNARIIEPALVPEKPSTLIKLIILGLGGVVGIGLAGATILILELRDTSIKTLKEAKELFGYTLLGAIPSMKKKVNSRSKETEWTVPELPARDTPRVPIAATYRMLQANLKFLSSDKPLQVIVVTSSAAKEGKSTVSANLAATMAQLGRRVLLVDADMHHPVQHHIWNLTNAAGLSDVIIGQAEFQAVVATGMTNLEVLTSGVIPPNPLALLDSKRMALLIEHFATVYDFVIIDAPPLVAGVDALTLGKMTDGVLLVARPMVLDSTSANAAKELLERSSQNVLGLVINGVIVEDEPDSYFYYAKGYETEEDAASPERIGAKR